MDEGTIVMAVITFASVIVALFSVWEGRKRYIDSPSSVSNSHTPQVALISRSSIPGRVLSVICTSVCIQSNTPTANMTENMTTYQTSHSICFRTKRFATK